ncbi:polyhydroxyalkanoate synthesis repressor PhaR [uncultured Castellaniella sp.]|jgi:polyhydroxyalkanoate synthesis repressor PhaR|uniref:polyhydroxyalkanoate synthesis repressor PhaR n=1 Tax=uncultured Castellaniella sp. TaxID=647907 RepID=UPI0026153F3B|nr:polyhydroxyalkanoate synthesis repressor PhaR [uncultured Castellaniella sp.]
MPQTTSAQSERLIKKYPNRRLYDTQSSAYITLADIKQLVLENAVFRVVDAKSGEDLTRSILLQIILEEESGGMPMFSANALAQIIRFYGHAMQGVMGTFLEKNIQVLMDIQDRMAEQSQGLYQQHFGPEAWAQLMNMQTPALQNMMNNYIEQSRHVFLQMQDQMQDQTRNLFTGFPFPGQPEPGKKKR